jgi:hypothetical protein
VTESRLSTRPIRTVVADTCRGVERFVDDVVIVDVRGGPITFSENHFFRNATCAAMVASISARSAL